MMNEEFKQRMRESVDALDERAKDYAVGELDPEIKASVMEIFPGTYSDLVAKLAAASENLDFESIRGNAHQIKGMAGTVGYPEISVVAKDLEEAAKAEDGERCRDLVWLLREWERVDDND